MITKNQEKLINSLHTKKGRENSGLCLVEGQKVIGTAGNAIEYSFSKEDTEQFDKLVTTETPQDIAAVAHIPVWSQEDILSKPTVIVLDGVQDPGNVGGILRLCLGFDASLLLVDSADVTSPKVIRSSVGAMFQVPWMKVKRSSAEKLLEDLKRPIYKLEKSDESVGLGHHFEDKLILIAGSEGHGIQLKSEGISLSISHKATLESLNVGHALAIVMEKLFSK